VQGMSNNCNNVGEREIGRQRNLIMITPCHRVAVHTIAVRNSGGVVPPYL
jgi:hypothetical protein